MAFVLKKLVESSSSIAVPYLRRELNHTRPFIAAARSFLEEMIMKKVANDPRFTTVKFKEMDPVGCGILKGTLRLTIFDRNKNFKVFLSGGRKLTIKEDGGKVRNSLTIVPTDHCYKPSWVWALRGADGGLDDISVIFPSLKSNFFQTPPPDISLDENQEIEVPFPFTATTTTTTTSVKH